MRLLVVFAALFMSLAAHGQARGEIRAFYPEFTIVADHCQAEEVMVLGGGDFTDITYECSFFQYQPSQWEKGCPPDEVDDPLWVSKLTVDGPGLESIHTEDCEMVLMEVLDEGRPDRLRSICLNGANISHCGDKVVRPQDARQAKGR